jgi:hypothetical protein
MFKLLDKLDVAFVSLLHGRDYDTGETLPGFQGGRGVSGTERVRIKNIAENTRIAVVHTMSQNESNFNTDNDETGESESNLDSEDIDPDPLGENDYAMNIARVYDRVTVELGSQLGSTDQPTN